MASDDATLLALEAMDAARQSALVSLRFLNSACALLKLQPVEGAPAATDGRLVRFDPSWALRLYRDNPQELTRAWLHMVLHNVFLHTYPAAGTKMDAWDAACDIVVEGTIDDLGVASLASHRSARQKAALATADLQFDHLTAESVYGAIVESNLDAAAIEELRTPFAIDDHAHWHALAAFGGSAGPDGKDGQVHEGDQNNLAQTKKPGVNGTDMDIPEEAMPDKAKHTSEQAMAAEDIVQKQAPEDARIAMRDRMANTVNLDRSREQWEHAALEVGVALDSYVQLYGTQGSSLSMNLRNVTRKKRDYRDFLRKFSRTAEHIRINDDEFDYVHYCYGLAHYGNLPLIEPLEYAEENRVRTFCIAIDTSASTKDGLVRRFLEETYAILGNAETFSVDADIMIVQCDAEITDVVHIHSQRDFDRYLDNLEIKGLGGTDFRPVFAYLDELIERRELQNLQGLLYLTDGFGSYPSTPPAWRSAFVFADDEAADAAQTPAWAMKVALGAQISYTDGTHHR